MIREVQNFNIEQVKKWINPENYDKISFKLLYRAIRDEWDPKVLHVKCYKRWATFTVIRKKATRMFSVDLLLSNGSHHRKVFISLKTHGLSVFYYKKGETHPNKPEWSHLV